MDNVPFVRPNVDMDMSLSGVDWAVGEFRRKYGFAPDTLFCSYEEFGLAQEVLNLLWKERGVGLNRYLYHGWPKGWWSVGCIGPFFGYGSIGA